MGTVGDYDTVRKKLNDMKGYGITVRKDTLRGDDKNAEKGDKIDMSRNKMDLKSTRP